MTVFFLIIVVTGAAILQYMAKRRGLEGLEAGHQLSSRLVEPGQTFWLTLSFVNRSRRMIPYIRWREHLPEEMEIHSAGTRVTSAGKGGAYVWGTAWLGPRQGLNRRIEASISKRGRYLLRELTLYGGDFLGIEENMISAEVFGEVVVAPREAPARELGDAFGGFLGQISVNRFIFEDPVLTVGYREYTGAEPMKMISWTQSARGMGLMVRKLDYTLEPSVAVALNMDGAAEAGSGTVESCCSLTRTVCRVLEDMGIKYAFYTNAAIAGELPAWNYVSPGLGQRHFKGILEGLGRAVGTASFPFDTLIERAVAGNGDSQGIILITPPWVEGLDSAGAFAKSRGVELITVCPDWKSEEAEAC